jgi:hypothetical protein
MLEGQEVMETSVLKQMEKFKESSAWNAFFFKVLSLASDQIKICL